MTASTGVPTSLEQLRQGLAGTLIEPTSTLYDHARRVWNGTCDRRPVAIVRCANAADASLALRHAAATRTPVTVRGGGHNVAGTAVADGALMIDLSRLRQVRVDPPNYLALADGGCLLRDLDRATGPHGLALPMGVVPDTGLGGLALGGGYGWLSRRWGLTCDHIVGAEVVLADGSIVDAAAPEHSDLLWALRGGGGNFGVVTRFDLRLRPVQSVLHGRFTVPLTAAGAALAGYRSFAEAQPPESSVTAAITSAASAEELAGSREPVLVLTAVWLGPRDRGQRVLAALAQAIGPKVARVRWQPFAFVQSWGDGVEPAGQRYFTKSCYLADLQGDAADALVEAARRRPSRRSTIDITYLMGAIAQASAASSAFPGRHAPYLCTASAVWRDPYRDADNRAWARETIAALGGHHYPGSYLNYGERHPPETVAAVYHALYARLAQVKARYDPGNVFNSNQNIAPASPRRVKGRS